MSSARSSGDKFLVIRAACRSRIRALKGLSLQRSLPQALYLGR